MLTIIRPQVNTVSMTLDLCSLIGSNIGQLQEKGPTSSVYAPRLKLVESFHMQGTRPQLFTIDIRSLLYQKHTTLNLTIQPCPTTILQRERLRVILPNKVQSLATLPLTKVPAWA